MDKNYWMKYVCLWALLSCIIVAASGCGKKLDSIGGTITLDGVPLENAGVRFNPVGEGGIVLSGYTDANGKYTAQTPHGKLTGTMTSCEYIVTVAKYEEYDTGKKRKNEEGIIEAVTDTKLITPVSYYDVKKSPLRVTVSAGKNTFDCELKKDGS